MSEKVLFVDDDPSVLAAYHRALRKDFRVETAPGAAQALETLTANGPFAVIVSDMRMPGMDGVQFLAQASTLAPDTVRIMLTGAADQQTAMDAVNEGHIFRFLSKPCDSALLAKAIAAGIQQYRLVMAEKELLRKTLRGSIKLLTDILSLVNPTAFGRGARVQALVRRLAAELKLDQPWELDVAAMLSQIGCVALPPDTMEKPHRGEPLTPEESRMLAGHPALGRSLLADIPRLEGVAVIIAYQDARFDGTAAGDGKKGGDIPLEARILKVALDFDALKSAGLADAEALLHLEERPGWYDPDVVKALETTVGAENLEMREVGLAALTDHMVLATDVRTTKGLLLACKGQETTQLLRQRLLNHALSVPVQEPIRVLVRRRPASGPSTTPVSPAPNRRPSHEPHCAPRG